MYQPIQGALIIKYILFYVTSYYYCLYNQSIHRCSCRLILKSVKYKCNSHISSLEGDTNGDWFLAYSGTLKCLDLICLTSHTRCNRKAEAWTERRSQRHSPRGKRHAPWSRVCPRWRMRHKPESEGPSASRHHWGPSQITAAWRKNSLSYRWRSCKMYLKGVDTGVHPSLLNVCDFLSDAQQRIAEPIHLGFVLRLGRLDH